MKIPKPTENDKERFRSLVPDEGRVEIKPMFGNLGAFVNGNMFMGLFGSEIGIKLAPEDRDALRGSGGGPFGPAERPMGDYVSLPGDLDEADARRWAATSFAYVAALPPKKKARGRGPTAERSSGGP